jgi:hypothetical protein
LAAVVLGLTAGCGGETVATVAPEDIGHVHDLVVDDDGLLAATHRGLLRLTDGTYRAVGDEIHDLMAVATMPNGDLVASGHPDLRLEKYRVDGAPSFLGLARSADDGETWDVVGLLGEVDFHALVATEAGILGGDSTGTVWRFDSDGEGQPVGSIPFDINDLAISLDDPAVIVATSWDGELAISEDAGQTWELQPDAPAIVEIEWTVAGLTGASTTGELWAASDPSGPFEPAGEVPDDVESLLVNEAGIWVATHGGHIHRRDDDGSWVPLVGTDD